MPTERSVMKMILFAVAMIAMASGCGGSAADVILGKMKSTKNAVCACKDMACAEKAEKDAKDAVARLIGEAEAARFDGRLICTWRANRPSDKPDWKALTADHPDLVASYTRTVPGPRVMRATRELGA